MLMGVLGIFVQGVALKFLNELIGERFVVMLSFVLGCIHNLLYGFAQDKAMIFVGVCVSAFVGMSFPTISAIKANNVVRTHCTRAGCIVRRCTHSLLV